VALSETFSLKDLAHSLRRDPEPGNQVQRLYPVVDNEKRLRGIVTRNDLNALIAQDQQNGANEHDELTALLKQHPIVAYPDEPLRGVIYRMADTGYTRFPVVESEELPTLVGMISLTDLLAATNRTLAEERKRERVLRIRTLFPTRSTR
jgi:CBS domain-containing protein